MTPQEIFIALIGSDPLKKSDAIILLEGDGVNRVAKTVQLFKGGWANLVVVSGGADNHDYGSYPNKELVPELQKLGVPKRKIILEDKSQNTRDQATEIMKIVKDKGWKRIILVGSHGNQHRAFLSFLKEMEVEGIKIEIINAMAELPWFEKNPWGKRIELLQLEFEKIEKYIGLGHLATFEEAINYFQWREQQT